MKALHSVSAWCSKNCLVLSEYKTAEDSNETAAIPFLLETLDLKSTTVTIDAAGCQKNITQIIKTKKADYILSLKKNHPNLYSKVEVYNQKHSKNIDNKVYDTFDESHNRLVRRRIFAYKALSIGLPKDWHGIKSVIAVESIRSDKSSSDNKVTSNWRFYLSSHSSKNKNLPSFIQNHWGG